MGDLDAFIRSYGYLAVFFGLMGEQFAPIPGEPLLLAARALAASARTEPAMVADVMTQFLVAAEAFMRGIERRVAAGLLPVPSMDAGPRPWSLRRRRQSPGWFSFIAEDLGGLVAAR